MHSLDGEVNEWKTALLKQAALQGYIGPSTDLKLPGGHPSMTRRLQRLTRRQDRLRNRSRRWQVAVALARRLLGLLQIHARGLMCCTACDSVRFNSSPMPTIPSNLNPLHSILRAWAVLWLLTFPLFHIHPETDPHHGEAGHIHAAALHTVFSPDLEGEFEDYHRDGHHHPQDTDSGPVVSAQGPHAWENDLELGFSLLNDATDRKLVKPLLAPLLFVTYHLLPVTEQRDQPAEQDAPTLSSTILACDLPARAPPSALLS